MSKHGSQKTLFPPNNDLQLSFEPPTWLLLLISGHHRSWHPFSDSWNDRSSFYLCLYGSLFWFIAFSVGFLRPVVKSKYLLTKFIFLAHPDHVYCVAWELTVSGIYALSTSSFFFAEHCAQFSHGVLLVALWRRCWSSVEIFTSNEKERIIVLWLLIWPALDYITRKKGTGRFLVYRRMIMISMIRWDVCAAGAIFYL